MRMIEEKESNVDRLFCSCCIHRDHSSVSLSKGTCKRELLPKLRFSASPFSCDRFGSRSICSDFSPTSWCVAIINNWKGFDNYYQNWLKYWKPKGVEHDYMSYILNGEENINYHIKYEDFVFNRLFRLDGRFNAFRRQYYKRKKSGFNYELVTEYIDGIEI